MAGELVACGICGLKVRFPGGQTPPDSAICENPDCQAEMARQVKAAEKPEKPEKPEPKAKKKKK